MGVDIGTYRSRIGTFRHGSGHDVVLLQISLNYTGSMKVIGVVAFIGILLLMAGIESNPGPPTKDLEQDPIATILRNIGLEQYIDKFKNEDTTVELINELTEADFKDIGVVSVGHRVRIRKACKDYQANIDKENGSGLPDTRPPKLETVKHDIENSSDASTSIRSEAKDKTEISKLPETDSSQEEDGNIDIVQSADASVSKFKTVDVRKEYDIPSSQHFDSLLQRLNLDKWFRGKISFTDVAMIDDDQSISVDRLPWHMLKAILMSDSGARDRTVREAFSDEDDICPLDVFIVLFHCCDGMLKQKMYKALLMSKIAAPFLYIDYNNKACTLPIWPMRSLIIEWGDDQGNTLDNFIYEQPTAIVSFARFGRPHFSKSKLLNELLFENTHNTFYNKDSPYGTNNRYLCKNYVEAAWYLPSGHTSDAYNNIVTFLNIRGDFLKECTRQATDFITKITDIIIICIDIDNLTTSVTDILYTRFEHNAVIVILTNDMKVEDATVQTLTQTLNQKLKHVDVIRTSHNGVEKGASDIQMNVQKKLRSVLLTIPLKPMVKALECQSEFKIKSDEEELECIDGFKLAKKVMSELKKYTPKSQWKAQVTPLHFKYSKSLKDLTMQTQRSCDSIQKGPEIKQKIRDIKVCQGKIISEPMKTVINIIVSNVNDKKKLLYFIEFLHLLLETKSKSILPDLRVTLSKTWDKLNTMKTYHEQEQDINKQKQKVKDAEIEIEDALFGLQHMFRETAHIFEALNEMKEAPQTVGLPEPATISMSLAKLFTYGYSFELVDGDSSYIPMEWVKSILSNMAHLTKAVRVLTLSVLGVQSSGKSTLLNTMFGLQFAVSAGRCTRGVYAQLLPTKNFENFDHIMIVDSEGLRAQESREEHRVHDNELATFVIGLGNITLLNIKGESTSVIQDVLQIVIHAFLRLRLANQELDTGQKCVFVHQNVAPISAEKMKYSLQKLVEQLDNITLEAAKSERNSYVTAFNQVIAFNENKHVFHIPDLWKGDPPMASTNAGYVRSVQELQTQITNISNTDNKQSYKCLVNISCQINDVWKGILSEDFVFKFKNSLEIKANIVMDETYKRMTWKLEQHIRNISQNYSEKAFNKCNTDTEVDNVVKELKFKLANSLEQKYTDIRLKLEDFFKHNDYFEIIKNWKDNRLYSFRELSSELKFEIIREIESLRNKRKLTINMHLSQAENNSKLYNASKCLAQELKGQTYSEDEIDRRFEEIWTQYEQGLKSSEPEDFSFHEIFIKRLRDRMFSADSHILTTTLSKYEKEFRSRTMKSLYDSYGFLKISESDLHLIEGVKSYLSKTEKVLIAVKEHTGAFFKKLDSIIDQNSHEDNELTAHHVHNLLYEIENWLKCFTIKKKHFTIYPTKVFEVKVCLLISYHAEQIFQLHNERYRMRSKKDSDQKLTTYKQLVNERFMGYLNNRKAESTAALVFRDSIEEFVEKTVLHKMSLKVESEMEKRLPPSKYSIIIDILYDLLHKESFANYAFYIDDPYKYLIEHVTERVRDLLFRKGRYFELAKSEIKIHMCDIAVGIKTARYMIEERNEAGETSLIGDWIQLVCDNISTCTIESERFEDVKRENVKDFNNFSKNIEEQLSLVSDSLEGKFKEIDSKSIKWNGTDSILRFCKKVWGCEEKCVYCGEPCFKPEKHSFFHKCLQHRPTCVSGKYNKDTKEASKESCNFLVQSDMKHNCASCKFRCKIDNKPCNCKDEWHRYRTYKKILKDWLIEPNSNMDETCKYWMWFIVKYKKSLEEYHSYSLDHIPEDWKNITEGEALDSLLF